jgi:hypothetical protein
MKYLRTPSAALALAGALLATSGLAHAGLVTYTYSGNSFYKTYYTQGAYTDSDRVTGSFTVEELSANQSYLALDPTSISFSFTDGHQTITSATSLQPCNVTFAYEGGCTFQISTDATGAISAWEIDLTVAGSAKDTWIETRASIHGAGDWGQMTYSNSYMSINNPGTWTSTAAAEVPEPASLALVGLALAGAAVSRRKQA